MDSVGPNIRVERNGAVFSITLDRPERLNAFTGTMRTDLRDAVLRAGASDAGAIVLTGAGRAFSAGADIDDLVEMLEAGDVKRFEENVRAGTEVIRSLRSAPQVVIGALNGVAAGAGASLAAACDLRIAADSARIGFTFMRIGLHPDWGATHTLPHLVGAGRAEYLFHSAELVEAHAALTMGLIDRVVPASELRPEALRWATELATRPQSRAVLKSTLRKASDTDLEQHLACELDAQLRCFRTTEALEAARAFLTARADARSGPSIPVDIPA
jgi:2-(1,2-epoxy-1,2-dihydrophenyl)acetyl-CoA isomerase